VLQLLRTKSSRSPDLGPQPKISSADPASRLTGGEQSKMQYVEWWIIAGCDAGNAG